MKRKYFLQKAILVFILIVTLQLTVFALNASSILNEAINNISKLETVALELNVEVAAEGLEQKMVMVLQSHLKEQVGRLEFKSPKEFSGQIIIVDKPKDQFINYYPTGQAIRMPLSQSSQSNSMNIDISKLLDLNTSDLANLDPNRYILQAEETVKNGTNAYLITVTDTKKEFGSQKVWLAKADKFPLAMEVFDPTGKKVMSLVLNKVEKNTKLDLKKLRTLPSGAVIFDM